MRFSVESGCRRSLAWANSLCSLSLFFSLGRRQSCLHLLEQIQSQDCRSSIPATFDLIDLCSKMDRGVHPIPEATLYRLEGSGLQDPGFAQGLEASLTGMHIIKGEVLSQEMRSLVRGRKQIRFTGLGLVGLATALISSHC